MTSVLLAVLVNLSPGVQLADNAALRSGLLIGPELRLVDDESTPPPNLQAMTREQLQLEYRRLDDSRPSLVGPIVFLAVGAAAAISGVILAYAGVISAFLGGSGAVGSAFSVGAYILLGVGAVLIIGGAVFAIIGAIKLVKTLRERREVGTQLDDVQRQIDTLDHNPGPPIAVPPQAGFWSPQPGLVLARF